MEEWFSDKRIALVGNAMSLFDKGFGPEIDDHEVVVRLNKAAMLYTNFDAIHSHGSRTTHWIFFNTAEYKAKFPDIDKSIKTFHISKHRQTPLHRKMVDFMMPMDKWTAVTESLGHKNPTTGFMSLHYITRCNPAQLDVYGFDWKDTPTFTDPERLKDPQCCHDFEKEREACFRLFFSKPNVTWRT